MNQIPVDSDYCNDHRAGDTCPCFDPFGGCQLFDVHLDIVGGDQSSQMYKKCIECKDKNPVIK